MAVVLSEDMLTIVEAPVIIVPGQEYSAGSGYEGHAYFEAASIRKRGICIILFTPRSLCMSSAMQ